MAKTTDTTPPVDVLQLRERLRAAEHDERDAPRRELLAELARVRQDRDQRAAGLAQKARAAGSEASHLAALAAEAIAVRDAAMLALAEVRDDEHTNRVQSGRAEAALRQRLRPLVDGLLAPARARVEAAERAWGLLDVCRGFTSPHEAAAAREISEAKKALAALVDHADPAGEAGRLLDGLEARLATLLVKHRGWRPTAPEPRTVQVITQCSDGYTRTEQLKDFVGA